MILYRIISKFTIYFTYFTCNLRLKFEKTKVEPTRPGIRTMHSCCPGIVRRHVTKLTPAFYKTYFTFEIMKYKSFNTRINDNLHNIHYDTMNQKDIRTKHLDKYKQTLPTRNFTGSKMADLETFGLNILASFTVKYDPMVLF
jgi:hypothetical protein